MPFRDANWQRGLSSVFVIVLLLNGKILGRQWMRFCVTSAEFHFMRVLTWWVFALWVSVSAIDDSKLHELSLLQLILTIRLKVKKKNMLHYGNICQFSHFRKTFRNMFHEYLVRKILISLFFLLRMIFGQKFPKLAIVHHQTESEKTCCIMRLLTGSLELCGHSSQNRLEFVLKIHTTKF